MSTSGVSDFAAGATGVLTSKFPLLRFFSMTPPPSQQQQHHPASPTMRPSSRSEKLLRDTLLRDERERQQQPPVTPPTHRRRHSHAPTSTTREGGPFPFHNPRSASPSGNELERDAGNLPVNRMLFYGGDVEGNHRQQSQDQQSTTPYRYHTRRSTRSPSPSPSRHSSTSISPSPSPLHMKRRQASPGLTSPNTHINNANTSPIINTLPTNGTNRRKQSLHNTGAPPNHYGSAYPQPLSHGQGEPLQMTPHEQALRARLEKVLIVSGGSDGRMMQGRGGDENEVRDEQGGWPWRRPRKSTGGSGSGSMISASLNTTSSSASNSTSHSSQSHPKSQLNHPYTPQTRSRTFYPTSTPNRTTQSPAGNHQLGPYHSPSSPHSPFSAPGGVPASCLPLPSHTRSRSQTDPNPQPPVFHLNVNSPGRNNTFPTTSPLPVASSSPSGSDKLIKSKSKSSAPPLPLSLGVNAGGDGEVEGELRLPTPPPTPPFMVRVPAGGYVPSPYKIATANPSPNGSGTPTRIPLLTQTPRKKEAGLETRRPTQGPAAAHREKGKEQEPLRPLNLPSASPRQRGGQRQRDVTVTQQSQARFPTIGPNPDPKQVNNTDGHSLASTESRSTRTSGSSASHSHSHVGRASASGYCPCSSHSSLDGPLASPIPPFVGDVYAHSPNGDHKHHHVHSHQSNPPSPSSPTSTKTFNARKASTQCRAIEGYVSFASVEGLGEPPLIGDEFDGDGFGERDGGGKGNCGKGRAFLPLGVWTAALGWKKFLGVGAGIGMEGQEQGVVV
ncbi:hypothetical protein BYT27DRAFT_7260790 [Phlegmacium glaucopus]|nr:hypothetical protein BYT27DRAFT_7260790 [Phlegmacium glaucopus]